MKKLIKKYGIKYGLYRRSIAQVMFFILALFMLLITLLFAFK